MRAVLRSVGLIVVLCVVAGVAVANDFFPQSVASGDPTASSIVLWTRAVGSDGSPPASVNLTVATDQGLSNVVVSRVVDVDAEFDGVVKVKVDGLSPYQDYFYQFAFGGNLSPIGRTRTAPTPAMDVTARFAVVYCQDYVGRYYNTYLKMLLDHDEDIDFIVHLGDYIYETTGDPQFQDPDSDRRVEFEDTEGAIQLGTPDNPNYAAASLSNYRDLYRTYRSDEILQEVHERWPMMVIWDDHEFSNDHWGATATYTNGRTDEYDVARRQNAEQAFYEWVPIDAGLNQDGELEITAADLYPNAMIYRDLIYGSNLHLVLTDLRTFRPDHLIPEDAFPGLVPVDEPTLAAIIGEAWPQVRENFDPYFDLSVLSSQLPILGQTAAMIAATVYRMENPSLDFFEAVRLGREAMSGNVSVTYINLLLEAAGFPPMFGPEMMAQLPRGISYLTLGKSSIYSSGGSRTQVIKDTFDLYAAAGYLASNGASQEVYGSQQNAWLQGTLLASPATWKVLGHSFMMTPLVIDFTNPAITAMLPPEFPDFLRTKLVVNAEDFNGLPQKTMEVLGLLSLVPNSVVISGDIHSTFVTDHKNGNYEITPPAISSSTNAEIVLRVIASDPILGQIPGIEQIIAQYGLLLQVSAMNPAVSTSDILYQNTWSHGYAIMDVTADKFTITIQEIPSDEVGTSYYDDPEALNDLFTPVMFNIQNGVLTPGP